MSPRDPALDLFAMMTVLGHAEDADRPAALDQEIEDATAYWSQALAPMAAVARPVAAPAGLWARIEDSVRHDMAAAGATDEASEGSALARFWNSLAIWRFLAAAGVAAAIALAVLIGRPPAGPAPAYVAVLQAPEGDRRAGFIVEIAADRTVRLVPLGTTEPGAEKSLQFWTLADKAKGPQSLGLVPGDRATTLSPDLLPTIQRGQLFEVTLEPYGGSPINRPTGPILFKGLADPVS